MSSKTSTGGMGWAGSTGSTSPSLGWELGIASHGSGQPNWEEGGLHQVVFPNPGGSWRFSPTRQQPDAENSPRLHRRCREPHDPPPVGYSRPPTSAGCWGDAGRLTRFLKSAVTSRVKTARLRKPVESSWLFWERWLLPKFSRASLYCSSFSTWAARGDTSEGHRVALQHPRPWEMRSHEVLPAPITHLPIPPWQSWADPAAGQQRCALNDLPKVLDFPF